MFDLQRFENTPVDSVTYIISNFKNNKAIVIDPGTENDTRITDFLEKKKLDLEFIFLTHEHFDHILGVNYLREKFPNVKVVASQKTSERLTNPKKNLAIFHNQMNLVVQDTDVIIEEGNIKMVGLDFTVHKTPGHTDSSVSLRINDFFFSGDFLLQGSRIVTNLPTGSRKQYEESLEKYSDMLEGLMIYPGHGDAYKFNSKK